MANELLQERLRETCGENLRLTDKVAELEREVKSRNTEWSGQSRVEVDGFRGARASLSPQSERKLQNFKLEDRKLREKFLDENELLDSRVENLE